MAVRRRLTTDTGTVVIHALLVITYIALLVTGLRIASDDSVAGWLVALDPVLPTDNLWFRHSLAAVIFTAALAGYLVYTVRARLTSRVRLDVTRVAGLLRGGVSRWKALTSFVHWAMLMAFSVLLVSGVMLFLDLGGSAPVIHLYATYVVTGLIASHVALHLAIGGTAQVLRIVRPAPLTIAPPDPDFAELLAEHLSRQAVATNVPETDPEGNSIADPREPAARGDDRASRMRPPEYAVALVTAGASPVAPRHEAPARTLPHQRARERPCGPSGAPSRSSRRREAPASTMTLHAHPMVSALIAAGAFATVAFGLEGATRPELEVSRITPGEAPKIDGDLSDPAWTRATPVSVVTTQGGDFGGSGQSTIEARALHDGEFAYFAFVWTDPTRSLKHLPLVKTRDGWSLAATDRSGANENRFHEDKFAVLISQPTLPLIGAAIHLSPAPLSDMPPSATHRGLHYTPDGSVADMWVWRASHEGADRHVDNCHFGGAATPTEEQRAGLTRYAGGFAPDPLPQAYYSNVVLRQAPTLAGRAETVPRRLPRDLNQTLRSLGRISDSAHQSEAEGARWWLAEDQSVAYSEERDAKIPLGTVIPGIVISSTAAPDPSALKGRARWASGRWTLEVVRRLRSPSRHDVPIADGSMLWLAAFDHSQTRHTRHLRPFTLEVDQ